MDFYTRLDNICKQKKTSVSAVLLECGFSKSTGSHWKTGTQPTVDIIKTLSEHLKVSPEYLAFGKETTNTLSTTERTLIKNFRQLPPDEQQQFMGRCKEVLNRIALSKRKTVKMVTIDIAEKAFGAGETTTYDDYMADSFYPREFPYDIVPAQADRGIKINGDSMQPNIPDESIVWIKEVHRKEEIKYGDVITCIFEGVPLCKIFQKDGLYSYNEKYKPIPLGDYNLDYLKIIGKVIGVYVEGEEYEEENFEITEIAARSQNQNKIITSTNEFD